VNGDQAGSIMMGDDEAIIIKEEPNGLRSRTSPEGCGAGAGVDNAWEQKKPEARKMLEKAPNPTCRVHALLGGLCFSSNILLKSRRVKRRLNQRTIALFYLFLFSVCVIRPS